MDPDTALAEIRKLLVPIDDADSHDPPDIITQLNELIEKVAALDTWLGNGGYLPNAWESGLEKTTLVINHPFLPQ